MAARQPNVPEKILRTAAKGRNLNLLRREQARRDPSPRSGRASRCAPWAAAEAALYEQIRREAEANWRTEVDTASEHLAGVGRLTPLQRERAARIQQVIDGGRRLSDVAIADLAGVDRSTIPVYVERGWVTRPEVAAAENKPQVRPH